MMMATNSNTRSRLLELPSELRQLTFEHLFKNQFIFIDPEKRFRAGDGSVNPKDRELPGILITSKLLRKENFPVLSRHTTAVIYEQLRNTPCDVPDCYLQGVRRAVLTDWFMDDFTIAATPQLEELKIEDGDGTDYFAFEAQRENESSFKAAIDALQSAFDDFETGTAVAEIAKSKSSLTILLEVQLEVRRVQYVSGHGSPHDLANTRRIALSITGPELYSRRNFGPMRRRSPSTNVQNQMPCIPRATSAPVVESVLYRPV